VIQLVLVVIQVFQVMVLEKKTVLKLKARYISAVILDISSMAQKKELVCQMEVGQEDNLSAKVNHRRSILFSNSIIKNAKQKINCSLPVLCCEWYIVYFGLTINFFQRSYCTIAMAWQQVTNLKSVPDTHETACLKSSEKQKHTKLFICSQSCVSINYICYSVQKTKEKEK